MKVRVGCLHWHHHFKALRVHRLAMMIPVQKSFDSS
jgi:hypothetical protein